MTVNCKLRLKDNFTCNKTKKLIKQDLSLTFPVESKYTTLQLKFLN